MQKTIKSKSKVFLAISSVVLTLALLAAIPVLARVSQETITVSFSNIRITVNGQTVQTEFEPFIFQGRTYLPVRDVANAMGFGVTWEDATNTVHLTSNAANPHQFVPATGSVRQQSIIVNFNNIRIAVDRQHVQTEFEPFIFQSRTYLPVRDVANAMGFDVDWDGAANTVLLTSRTGSGAVPNYPPHQPSPSPSPTASPRPTASPSPSPSPSPTASPRPTSSPSPSPTASPRPTASPSPSPTASPSGGQGSRPSNPAISLQRAIEIAYADLANRGINATFHSDSGMDWERGQWVWELEFRVTGAQRGRHVIEYYINVDTGAIVKFEQGD